MNFGEHKMTNLNREHLEYLLKLAGESLETIPENKDEAEKLLLSKINLDLLKNKLVEIVPTLEDVHKTELKQYLIKKFKLTE